MREKYEMMRDMQLNANNRGLRLDRPVHFKDFFSTAGSAIESASDYSRVVALKAAEEAKEEVNPKGDEPV